MDGLYISTPNRTCPKSSFLLMKSLNLFAAAVALFFCAQNTSAQSRSSTRISDMLMVLNEFGCAQSCNYDMSGDGSVTTPDILQMLSLFGSTCPE